MFSSKDIDPGCERLSDVSSPGFIRLWQDQMFNPILSGSLAVS